MSSNMKYETTNQFMVIDYDHVIMV